MFDDIQSLLKKRQILSDPENNDKWCIKTSEISGKGVFSCEAIEPGKVIFHEDPLVIGPRSAALPAACAVCWRLGGALWECSGGCRLPVCGQSCSETDSHRAECDLLASRTRPLDHWSPLLYRALTPLRCLLLGQEERAVLRGLSQNTDSRHIEIKFLMEELEEGLSSEEEKFLDLCCRVLNGVAFEIELETPGELSVSWRGLYPLAGTMNHSCSPNTSHRFAKSPGQPARMTVLATRQIAPEEEVTTSYCPLLWSTSARRHFLRLTKEFLCACQRCTDPTEFGTYFSAQVCGCGGFVLPESALSPKSGWRCRDCGRALSAKEALALEALCRRRRSAPHQNNHLAVQAKVDYIWAIGHNKRPYTGVSDEELIAKEKAIKEVMDVNDGLRLGESRLREILENELNDTREEMSRRKSQLTNARTSDGMH